MDPAVERKRVGPDDNDGAAIRMRPQSVKNLRWQVRHHRYAFAPQLLAGSAHPLGRHMVEVDAFRQAADAVVEGEDGAAGAIRYRFDRRRGYGARDVAGK